MSKYCNRSTGPALLLLSLLAAQGVASQSPGAIEWTLVAPPGEGFSVRMPVKPKEQTDRVPVMGNTYQMRMYTSADSTSGMVYMVVMQEVSSAAGVLHPSKRIEEFMKGFKEGIEKSMPGLKMEVVQGRDVDLKDHFGRQYALSIAESRGVIRTFDSTNRVYVLIVVGADERNSNAARFFDSFEFTPAPAPVPRPITSD